MTPIAIVKLDHAGREVLRYMGHVLARGENWVQVEAIFQPEVVDQGVVVFRRGDRFVEWFYTDRWYSIFEVHDGVQGALKGWYCNLSRPALLTEHAVSAEDLELDLWVCPDGTLHMLDEDDFATLRLPPDEAAAVDAAVEVLRRAVKDRTPPFDRIVVLD